MKVQYLFLGLKGQTLAKLQLSSLSQCFRPELVQRGTTAAELKLLVLFFYVRGFINLHLK